MSVSTPDDYIACKTCGHPKSIHLSVGMGNAPPFCKAAGCKCPSFT
ncbi:MAG TPA: hypothetical protein VJR94_08455 [Candidatus Nitrosocosmicus sp.]|nr:hypothetical protein [Candidatus Nitrosocosmicus sp.]